jgi:hypothetical protein
MVGAVHFEPTKEDYVKAISSHAERRISPRWRRNMLILTGIAVPSLIAPHYLIGEDFESFGVLILVAVATFLIIAFSPLVVRLHATKAGQLFDQQRSIHRVTDFHWSSAGARWVTDQGTVEIAWSDYHGWAERPSAFLLYLNEAMFHFIPKRVLEAADMHDLAQTLEDSGLKSV